jgi:hypothetical protein
MSNKKDLKAYVRFDGTGRIIAGSLILQRFKPKVGNWKEIDANECCNFVPTTTTTTTATPTTTTTTTTTSALCYCYVVSNPTLGSLNSEYTPCGETTPLTTTIRPGSTNVFCSATPVVGEVGLEITGGTSPCLNNGDCG